MCVKIFFCFSEHNIYFLNLKSKQRNALISLSSQECGQKGPFEKKKDKETIADFSFTTMVPAFHLFLVKQFASKEQCNTFHTFLTWRQLIFTWKYSRDSAFVILLTFTTWQKNGKNFGANNVFPESFQEFQQSLIKVRYKSKRIWK